MILPKGINRFCPYCRKHSEHTVKQAKAKTRSSVHPLTRYGPHRSGSGHGFGNLGKLGSKPAISKWKMTGSKQTKKVALLFECKVCKKSHQKFQGFRAKRVEIK
ncbi:MAG: 50S ribosomal protein L44e [Candidatus Woesearchaeota archaeon]